MFAWPPFRTYPGRSGLHQRTLWKAGEVAVRRADLESVLDGQGGQVRIADQAGREPVTDDQSSQYLGMPRRGLWYPR